MEWIQPMEPILATSVPEGDGFIHQVKWDGIRGLCYLENGSVRVFTKKGRERTAFYPELLELPSLINCKKAVLDGEMIVLNEDSKPAFQLILARERVTDASHVNHYRKKYPVHYIAFDLLFLNDELLTDKPFYKRDALLREHLKTNQFIAATDNFEDGKALFGLMKEKGWEGIVSKKLNSPYLPAKAHQEWFKIKLSRRLLAIVAGVTLKEGKPNALVLALQGINGLTYIGRTSTGLAQEHFRLLKENLQLLATSRNPFSENSSSAENYLFKAEQRELKNVVWFKPQLTVWVSFLEWTSGGGIRHPKLVGFSSLSPEKAVGKEIVE